VSSVLQFLHLVVVVVVVVLSSILYYIIVIGPFVAPDPLTVREAQGKKLLLSDFGVSNHRRWTSHYSHRSPGVQSFEEGSIPEAT